jgi:hypothetical protein
VSDLFAVVVGPLSLVVDGNVIFRNDLSVAAVEDIIKRTNEQLRARWPMIQYIYLTPVPAQPRLSSRSSTKRRVYLR